MINVAVVFGGESFEHDISVITAVQLLGRANMPNYNLIPIYIDKNGKWFTGDELFDLDNYGDFRKLKECAITCSSQYLYYVKRNKLKQYVKIDVAIMCLHGGQGEGGGVSGLFDLADIPYSACDLCASAICLDKVIFKDIMRGLSIATVDGFCVNEEEYLLEKDAIKEKINKFGYPIILKPSRLGSSIGVEVVGSENEFDSKLVSAFKYDSRVLIEKYVDIDKEINIALLKDKGSLIYSNTEEPIRSSEILSFDEKYKKGVGGFESIKRIYPAKISDKLSKKIKDISGNIYTSLNLYGVVRFDFILDKNKKLYINEVNTIPGSMANYLFDKDIYPYEKVIDILISNAINRNIKLKKNCTAFSSDVLASGMKILEK